MKKRIKCCACNRKSAVYEVLLYDVYPYPQRPRVFWAQDFTCPYLCNECMLENEQKAEGVRKPRGVVHYPYTNRDGAQGFSIYRPLPESERTVEK